LPLFSAERRGREPVGAVSTPFEVNGHSRKEGVMTPVVSSGNSVQPDYAAAVKVRQQAMWGSGDYAVIGATLQIVGELLNEAVDVRAGERVLDVAAGNGNATLAAARRFAVVTSTDYVPALLERGRLRADAEGFGNIVFQTADAEALPYSSASFDVVLSTFGVMFAPDHERVASELLRVCRPGGRIGLASWTPSGFLGQLFRLIGKYVPPPAGISSPLLWGTDSHLRELFSGAAQIEQTTRLYAFRYRSAAHWIEVFRTFYGPVHKAFLALDEERQEALEADLVALLRSLNRGGDASLVVPGEYLETVITR
jgi:ubiquinone/menaquinone biosynthesis C-methylase UbiE